MGQKIGVGIVGAGMIADWHATGIREHGGGEVVAVFDVVPERARAAQERWGAARVAESVEALVSDDAIGAVIVATPPAAHAEPTIAALQAGKHVLCEKPFALDPAEATAMVQAAESSTGLLACASSRMRINPVQRTARRMIEAGQLGDVYYAHCRMWRLRGRPGHHYAPQSPWFLDSSLAGGGVIMDLGVYLIDAVLALLRNPKVVSVTTQSRRVPEIPAPEAVLHDVEDHAVIMLQCDDGVSAVVETSWVTNFTAPSNTIVLGTEAGLGLDPFTKITARHAGDNDDSASFTAAEETLVADPAYRGGNGFYLVTMRFLDDIAAGVQPETSGLEALEITRIIDAAYRSAEAGASIVLDRGPLTAP